MCLLRGDAVKWNCGAVTSLRSEGSGILVLLDLNKPRAGSEHCHALHNLCQVSENTEKSAFPSLGVPTFFLLWVFCFVLWGLFGGGWSWVVWGVFLRASVFCQNFGTSCPVTHKHA